MIFLYKVRTTALTFCNTDVSYSWGTFKIYIYIMHPIRNHHKHAEYERLECEVIFKLNRFQLHTNLN